MNIFTEEELDNLIELIAIEQCKLSTQHDYKKIEMYDKIRDKINLISNATTMKLWNM